MKKNILAYFVISLVSTSLFAQTTTKTHSVSMAINNILELEFDTSPTNLGFTFAVAADFESGKTNLVAAGLRVRSNKAWTVSVKANAANFTPGVGGDTNVAANTLGIRRNGTTTSIPLTTTDQTLSTGAKGGFGTNTFSIDYIANPGYIAPATYTLGVTFTVTAP